MRKASDICRSLGFSTQYIQDCKRKGLLNWLPDTTKGSALRLSPTFEAALRHLLILHRAGIKAQKADAFVRSWIDNGAVAMRIPSDIGCYLYLCAADDLMISHEPFRGDMHSSRTLLANMIDGRLIYEATPGRKITRRSNQSPIPGHMSKSRWRIALCSARRSRLKCERAMRSEAY